MFRAIKKRFREDPKLGPPYVIAARTWARFSIRAQEALSGRYYTGSRFDRIFRSTLDPWGYESDPVAAERMRLIMKRLPRARYDRLMEIGCAEGWMTTALATRAEIVIAADISSVALERAKAHSGSFSNIRFKLFDLLTDELPGSFDAVVCAGVLVFVPEGQQETVRNKIVSGLEPGGDLLLEHTRHAYPGEVAGAGVHQLYRTHTELEQVDHVEAANYAITVFRKKTA